MLIIVLYLAFVVLGLPGALLGSAWPVMQRELHLPVHYAGILAMLISGGTIFSSLMTDRILRRVKAGSLVIAGVCAMALAMFGFAVSGSFWLLCLWAIPLGLGSGAVDAVINNYIAVHYTSRHMNWLHCFWGLGAMVGPYVMGFYLTRAMPWGYGFGAVGAVQAAFITVLLASLKKWKENKSHLPDPSDTNAPSKGFAQLLRIRGVKYALIAFFGYCALEGTAGLWASTFLVSHRGVGAESAALFASFFFMGITAGRFLTGIVSNRLGDGRMILTGLAVVCAGILAVWLPLSPTWVCLGGLVIIGLGCAPVFPSFIHATPESFGKEHSQAIIGMQMASAYTGATLMPPLFGALTGWLGVGIFPAFLFAMLLLTLGMTLALIKTAKRQG
jgi:fucose permease